MTLSAVENSDRPPGNKAFTGFADPSRSDGDLRHAHLETPEDIVAHLGVVFEDGDLELLGAVARSKEWQWQRHRGHKVATVTQKARAEIAS